MSTNRILPLAASFLFSAFILHPLSLRAQGSLTPPGAPAPTMKSLDQIEARTPVDATHTPGNASEQFIITQPGSYYLTGNITAAAGVVYGILIESADVTLDLNGFAMTGLGAGYIGIVVDIQGGAQNIIIRNGTLRNWAIGLEALTGCCEVDYVRAYACVVDGFDLGDNCTVKNCTAVTNGGTGILVANGCAVTDCLVASNFLSGIAGGNNCNVSKCNANSSVNGDGVSIGMNGLINQCVAVLNISGFSIGNNSQICQCVANTNNGFGIVTGVNCTIQGCTANGNVKSGLDVFGECILIENNASGNTIDGVVSLGTGNHIENNKTFNNVGYGIYSASGPNVDVIVRNRSSGNGVANYYPTSGTTFGPLQTPATATSPWANF